jgi:hypothetical protein
MNSIIYCKSYFNGFQEIRAFKENNKVKNFLAALKILSYLTVVIPFVVAGLYGSASLYGRMSKKINISSCDQSVNDLGKKNILKIGAVKSEAIISDEIKKIKTEYTTLLQGRTLPELLGYNQYALHKFTMLMPGIALIASLLCKKNKLKNLWVCQSNNAFQEKLKEIKNSTKDQRHALIVQTHSSMNSSQHLKKEDWEQHKMTVCVEKINGHMHIYMLETMVAEWNSITKSQIHLKEDSKFTEQELILAHINAIGLDQTEATIYIPVTRREFGGGCSTFALRDAVYFLRDNQFVTKLVISAKERMTLPISHVVIRNIEALPPECMQMAQSMSILDEYQKNYAHLASQKFGPPHRRKTIQDSLNKHSAEDAANKKKNLYISQRVLKYQALILEIIKNKDDTYINDLINRTLLKASPV